MKRWLLKTEPQDYSYTELEWEGRGTWDGVRNPQALAYLKQAKPGDAAFIYHTGKEKAIVGIATITSKPYPDPKSSDPGLPAVDLTPSRRLPRPITLAEIKESPGFAEWELVRLPRLSVMPVTREHWNRILKMSEHDQVTAPTLLTGQPAEPVDQAPPPPPARRTRRV
jgi:predicted RNA-binding protein with PUA-like domain